MACPTIDRSPLDDLLGVFQARSRSGKDAAVRAAYATVAVEVQHAIVEGWQNLVIERLSAIRHAPLIGSPQATKLASHKQSLIIDELNRANGNQVKAAASLGISPRVLNYQMQRFGLRPKDQNAVEQVNGV